MTMTEAWKKWEEAQAKSDAAYREHLVAARDVQEAWLAVSVLMDGPDHLNTQSARKSLAVYEELITKVSAAAGGGESEAPNSAPG